jgi:hypothetical protein
MQLIDIHPIIRMRNSLKFINSVSGKIDDILHHINYLIVLLLIVIGFILPGKNLVIHAAVFAYLSASISFLFIHHLLVSF